jgi:DNA-binding response OmpR family regulator
LTEDGAPSMGRHGRGREWYAAENPYDAIVLDVGLPGQDGFEPSPRRAVIRRR